jgi:PAS domain S-box-containing protein
VLASNDAADSAATGQSEAGDKYIPQKRLFSALQTYAEHAPKQFCSQFRRFSLVCCVTATLPAELAAFVANTAIPVTVAAPGDHDRVLVAANRNFCQLTGYDESEILGRDCRFLQGAATTPESRRAMHRFFEDSSPNQTRVEVVNYRKGGRPFVNLVFLSKLRDLSGAVRFLFASQFDVSHASASTARNYDDQLSARMADLQTLGKMHQLGVETSLSALATSTYAIATAKLALAEIEARAS